MITSIPQRGIFTRAAATLALCCAAATSALAAPALTAGTIAGVADILNQGTVLTAYNLGSGAGAVTVNGVAFAAGSDPIAAGLSGMANGGGDFSHQFTAGSALDQLLTGLAFQYEGTSNLNLTGLNAGQDYLLQLLFSNDLSGNNTGKNALVEVQGTATNLNFTTNANYLRIAFTAQGSSETIQFGNGGFSEPERMVLNAYVLETGAVPEPGSLALVGLALVGAGVVRRQSKR